MPLVEISMKNVTLLAAFALIGFGAIAYAQQNMMPKGQGQMMQHGQGHMMQGMQGTKGGMAMGPQGDTGPSSQAFYGVNMKMHKDMEITYTGNADVDFVRGMIPHHQGAIDMAKTEIAFGKDADIKKMAEDIIKAQEAEIAQMKDWLSKHGN